LKINAREYKFTITVTFDTLELYGVVQGSREVVIEM